MGHVWSAVRESDGRPFALKVLKVSGVDSTRRLVREARIAQRLRHPNIVRVEEIFAPPSGSPIVVLELLDGQSLRERLAHGSLDVTTASRIVGSAAAAVGSAHARGIVHRDLKPENLYLHRGGEDAPVTKVLDFGIAKVTNAEDLQTAGMTHTGTMLGTPAYMAPEQIFGERDLDGRADVWALGVILYECLSGARPFEGDNAGQIFKAVTMGKASSLALRCPDLPEDVVHLVDRMLTSERAERPAMGEVLDVLGRHTQTTLPAIELVPANRVDRESTPEDLWTPPPTNFVEERAFYRGRSRFRTLAGSLLFAAALGVSSLALMRSAARTATTPTAQERSATRASDISTKENVLTPTVQTTSPPPSSSIQRNETPTLTADVAIARPRPKPKPFEPTAIVPAVPVASDTARLPGGVHATNPY